MGEQEGRERRVRVQMMVPLRGAQAGEKGRREPEKKNPSLRATVSLYRKKRSEEYNAMSGDQLSRAGGIVYFKYHDMHYKIQNY